MLVAASARAQAPAGATRVPIMWGLGTFLARLGRREALAKAPKASAPRLGVGTASRARSRFCYVDWTALATLRLHRLTSSDHLQACGMAWAAILEGQVTGSVNTYLLADRGCWGCRNARRRRGLSTQCQPAALSGGSVCLNGLGRRRTLFHYASQAVATIRCRLPARIALQPLERRRSLGDCPLGR